MLTPDKQLSAEQSRQVAETIREEIARRRISRQSLAEQAKLSLSTLEKVLGGRRPFTLATTVRLEQALGVSLRKGQDVQPAAAPANGDISPDGLGAYSRRSVAWLEGVYVTARPASPDHRIASENIRRNVRHHHDAAGGARLVADADRGADRVFADQEYPGCMPRADFV